MSYDDEVHRALNLNLNETKHTPQIKLYIKTKEWDENIV